MSINLTPLPATSSASLRLIAGGSRTRSTPWWERRAQLRTLVGGCSDHGWNPTARRTAACTCHRF